MNQLYRVGPAGACMCENSVWLATVDYEGMHRKQCRSAVIANERKLVLMSLSVECHSGTQVSTHWLLSLSQDSNQPRNVWASKGTDTSTGLTTFNVSEYSKTVCYSITF